MSKELNDAVTKENEEFTEVMKRMVDAEKKLKDDARLKIGAIGCGNAGNQSICALYNAGITTNLFAINTSEKDLSDEIVSRNIPAFVAGGEGRGSGKDRAKAAALFKENGQEIFTKHRASKDIIHNCDIIVVVFSTGGGTGSYIGPAICGILAKMFANSQKLVIAYGITPKLADSAQAHRNSLASIDECRAANIPILLDDLSQLEDLPYEKAYEKVGQNFVNYVKCIRGDFSIASKNGMIDENDTLRTIGEPGYQVHYHLDKLTVEMLEQQDIQLRLLDEVKKSPSMTVQKDGVVEYMAVFSSYPTSFDEGVRDGNYSKITEYVGLPRDIFQNYGEALGTTADIHVILSGLTLPYDRILQSKDKVEERENSRKRAGSNVDLHNIMQTLGTDERTKIQNKREISEEDLNAALDFFK